MGKKKEWRIINGERKNGMKRERREKKKKRVSGEDVGRGTGGVLR